jgi:hypothetical protein
LEHPKHDRDHHYDVHENELKCRRPRCPFDLRVAASCRSLLLSLTDLEIIERGEAVSILEDAAAHRGAIAEAKNPQAQQAAADVIDRIVKGKNSVRHA